MWPPSFIREEPSMAHLSLAPPTTISVLNSIRESEDPERNMYKIHYLPISSLTSMCCMVYAPPLDVLRRPADTHAVNREQQRRTSRYWLVLIELRLVFFQFYGDSKARFTSNIKEASVSVTQENKNILKLTHSDKRIWHIEFETKIIARQFEFVVQESQKSLQGKSLLIRADRQESKLRTF